MLTKIELNAPRTIGILAEGTVTKQDYEEILIPLLEKRCTKEEKVRFLFQIGPNFKGFTLGAAWDDLRVGVKFYHLFEKCAVVSDEDWIRHASQFFGIFMPCPVKVFSSNELKIATEWLKKEINEN